MRDSSLALRASLLLLAVLAVAACGGDDIVAPTTGTLEITTTTTGAEPDLDGYTIQVDAGTARSIGSTATLPITQIPAGPHTIQLGGVAVNCSVSGSNVRSVSALGGETATVEFDVTCSPTTGSIQITSSTNGPSPDADGYTLTLDGADHGPIAVSASITITGLLPGSYLVGLIGVSANCQVEQENPRTVVVTAGTSSSAAFAVSCQMPPPQAGTLQVSTGTTGIEQDGDGYIFLVDGGASQPIGLNAKSTVPNVSLGDHLVKLAGIAANCSVSGTNPRNVTLTAGATAEVAFSVSCTARRPLELVSARDHIPGGFTTPRSVYADRDHIYLGSYDGTLFVLARDRASDFPITQTIAGGTPITGIRGDDSRLYVASAFDLRVYTKGAALRLAATPISKTYLGTVELFEGKIYVTVGQAGMAVDHDWLYLSQLNEGDIALEIDKVTLRITRTYGKGTFFPERTVVFDRGTGVRKMTLSNPTDLSGAARFPSLYSDGHSLMQTIAGCCGFGITLWKAPDFTKSEFIDAGFANVVTVSGNGLLVGTEAGSIDYFRENRLVDGLDLRAATGHTAVEDVEIRSIWADGLDDLIFAGSSWGNEASRGPLLPSFFVASVRDK